ncbi:hypothetical protein [Parasediminibacterium sp. JCM 36343]|uniref:hypothetical protein n=1 Tax=Parasediminibacterium sp. JCM 36343 TaxID=3374279 RepID=UPI00397AC0AB
MNATNVKLSPTELMLATDAGFILTKNGIIQKVYGLFGAISESCKTIVATHPHLPLEIKNSSPKISKGENYEGLPWVMLDYPRCFSNTGVFAIRLFFLWGNFVSVTLHLQGSYREQFQNVVKKLDAKPRTYPWFVCVANDAWQHHFRSDNYQLLSVTNQETIQQMPFVKLAKKIPLQEWDNIYAFVIETFSEILNAL